MYLADICYTRIQKHYNKRHYNFKSYKNLVTEELTKFLQDIPMEYMNSTGQYPYPILVSLCYLNIFYRLLFPTSVYTHVSVMYERKQTSADMPTILLWTIWS